MIRQAELKDALKVSELILMASSVLFRDVIKSDDLKKQQELLLKYIETEGTKFYYKNLIVEEIDGEVAGVLVGYEADEETTMNEKMESMLDSEYKFAVEGYPHTIYLDSMAVDPKYRGLGISRNLFNHAIENAEKDLSLLVETFKESTKDYYERVGFEIVDRVDYFNADLYLMLYKK